MRNTLRMMLIALIGTPALAASFTSETDWLAELPVAPTPVDFNDVAPVEFAPGVNDLPQFDVKVNGGVLGDAEINTVPNFVINFADNRVNTLSFVFDEPIVGFAAEWSNSFVSNGWVIETPAASYELEAIAGGPFSNFFIGFTEDTPFTEFTMRRLQEPGPSELVFFGNTFQFAVPEPASMLLLIASAPLIMRRR